MTILYLALEAVTRRLWGANVLWTCHFHALLSIHIDGLKTKQNRNDCLD